MTLTLQTLVLEDFDEEESEEQERIEQSLEQAIDTIDPKEIRIEIQVIEELLHQTEFLRRNFVERKYDELERTLFGADGLLEQGEKIIIFTEYTDTLYYLERRLKQRIKNIAKIVGSLSMEERRKQVEFFRDHCQVMLATDAGGESINLQFCNQMINYDIPWNPNRLEQRMGRIHRIGQKNDVAIFNMVAANTQEGEVMIRLLEKMEQMRRDLGSDLVYDFIGEILDDESGSLADLMEAAILNRENLDELIEKMDKRISKEHQRLIQFFESERLADHSFDLPLLRREQHDRTVQTLPARIYAEFVNLVLSNHHVRVHSTDGKTYRIDRFPKFIRDFARQINVSPELFNHTIKFTGHSKCQSKEAVYLDSDNDLVKLSMHLAQRSIGNQIAQCYAVPFPFSEKMIVNMYECLITDGTGTELSRELIFLGLRENGEVIRIDPYWVLQVPSGHVLIKDMHNEPRLSMEAIATSVALRNEIKGNREVQLDKVERYLVQTFSNQIDELLKKRFQYEQDNENNKNSALINQINSNLVDVELRRDERLELIRKQRSISMKPPKLMMQFEWLPVGSNGRVIASDYFTIIEQYEKNHGRGNLKMFHALALVDFYSERFNGEPRFIIVTTDDQYDPSEDHLEDLRDIIQHVYIYRVSGGVVVEEKSLM